ncbi:conserved hypothetical protein [Brucella melitensis bv. 3 str. Ether]|nr:conserved hypothetical protein [Brucella melitensis bv. 3 str. Ether]
MDGPGRARCQVNLFPPFLSSTFAQFPPPITRHATIFSMIDTLEPGEVPEIVNDHDPVPLRNQLEHRNPGAFSWVYKETGPLWRVEIGRRKVHASDHECTCGNH